MFSFCDNLQIEKITNRDKNAINNVHHCVTVCAIVGVETKSRVLWFNDLQGVEESLI